MTTPVEQALRQTPGGPEQTATQTVELHRSMFAKGTVGYSLFSESLEGRLRPMGIFTSPLDKLSYYQFTPDKGYHRAPLLDIHQLSALVQAGVMTFSDVLNMQEKQFQTIIQPYENTVRERLSRYLGEYVASGPEGVLLSVIFQDEGGPISKTLEPLRKKTLQKALESLPEGRGRTLGLHFGLTDGQQRTFVEIAAMTPSRSKDFRETVTPQRIQQLGDEALKKLRHPSKSNELRLFFPLHHDSIGRVNFRLFVGHDLTRYLSLPDIERLQIKDLHLSDRTLIEVSGRLTPHPYQFMQLISISVSHLSEESRLEIVRALQVFAKHHSFVDNTVNS